MLTVIMESRDNEPELAQTLSALVAGAVEGIVRDVIVLDHGSGDGSPQIADAAGCRFMTEWSVDEIVRSARGDWLLLLEPGARPLFGWVDAISEHVSLNKGPARFAGSRKHRRPFMLRLVQRRTRFGMGAFDEVPLPPPDPLPTLLADEIDPEEEGDADNGREDPDENRPRPSAHAPFSHGPPRENRLPSTIGNPDSFCPSSTKQGGEREDRSNFRA